MSRSTILKGMQELSGSGALSLPPEGRLRRAGGGRKSSAEVDPGLERAVERVMRESTAGDPMSTLKWTTKSTRSIAAELERCGHSVCYVTVARCLHNLGYSLQANVKTIEGSQHPDRDAQFHHINRQVKSFMRSGDPVISVDTKKKELVGAFRNAGRTWRRQGEPSEVFTHDFPHLGKGKAVPYGTYDVARDQGLVNVGISHDTGEFAVESIRRWWRLVGKRNYAQAERLLICADAGGSNGSRLRAWKLHLQRLAHEIGIPISVCHYPPGTSKWNKIEHRLFSFISLTWKGQPLVSFETVVNLIGSTRTRSGLRVKAVLDTRQYEAGQEVSAKEMKGLNLKGDAFHPDWNYTLAPKSS